MRIFLALDLRICFRFGLSAPTAGHSESKIDTGQPFPLFRLALLLSFLVDFTGLKTAFLVPMGLRKFAGTLAR